MDALKRFWRKSGRRGPNECWLWTGEIRTGYGRFWYQGHMVTAHRFIYEQMVGHIPPRHEIDHVCRQQSCVNPKHLRSMPHRENCIRRYTNLVKCPQGHRYTAANLMWTTRSGGVGLNRRCRICLRERHARRQAAKVAAREKARLKYHFRVPKVSDREKLRVMREARRRGMPNPFGTI